MALWNELTKKSILITGGTGFFGKSIIEYLKFLRDYYGLEIKLTILTRDPEKFKSKSPHLCNPDWVTFLKGDITNFSYPPYKIDLILHLATPTESIRDTENSLNLFETTLLGTRNLLEFAKNARVKTVLFTSSGAVYGRVSSSLQYIPEDYSGAPPTHLISSSYGEAKRACEVMGNLYSQKYNFGFKIARCFSFVGPYLSSNGSFAIGSFIDSAINNRKIEIQGDGSPLRSYLFAEDLCFWLFKILIFGKNTTAYNVGSDETISIGDLAAKVIRILNPGLPLIIKAASTDVLRGGSYVPNITKAKNDLGLEVLTPLDLAITKTAEVYRNKNQN